MDFRSYRKNLSPPWLQSDRGASWQTAFGSAQDDQIERARRAALIGFPEHAPADALGWIGDERRIERGLGESDESYRERLRIAFETWRWAGTERGIRTAFESLGFSNVGIVRNRDWDPSPPDHDTTRWARYWLVIGLPHPVDDDGLWDDDSEWGENGSPGYWGGSMTESLLLLIWRLLRLWSPAHATCAGVVINLDSDRVDIASEPETLAQLDPANLSTGERIIVIHRSPEKLGA